MTTTPYPTFPDKLFRPQWFVPHWSQWAKKDRGAPVVFSALALFQLVALVLFGGFWVNWVMLVLFGAMTLMTIQTANMNLDSQRLQAELDRRRAEMIQMFRDPYLHHPYDDVDPGNRHPDDHQLR